MTSLEPAPARAPEWQAAAEAVRAARKILLVSHIAPDGDAVGSLLGLALPLRALGKRVTAALDDGVPQNLQATPGSEIVATKVREAAFDLMIALDCSDVERLGRNGALGMRRGKRVINLDHHATNTGYGDIHLIVTEAVAAAEIVYDFLDYMQLEITPDCAQALLTGLVTDTRGFRISATSQRTLEIAQKLMERGADLARIMAQTLNRRAFAEVELWRLTLPSVSLENGLIQAVIRQSDIQQAGMQKMGDGGLVSYLVNVDGARLSAVFKELPNNAVEIGFRSKPGVDVASLAYALGGGGHKQASGCTIGGTLAEAQARVLPLARQAIAEGTDA